MKTRSPLAAMIALSIAVIPISLAAQDFSITRYTIGAGGGTSTQDGNSVTGTIGQAEVGVTSSGDDFEVTGGFWTILRSTDTEDSTDGWVIF